MGYIKRILPKRPDLRVIITSATIDAERFAGFFEGPRASKVAGFSESRGTMADGRTPHDEGGIRANGDLNDDIHSSDRTLSLDSESPATLTGPLEEGNRQLPSPPDTADTLTPNPSPEGREEPDRRSNKHQVTSENAEGGSGSSLALAPLPLGPLPCPVLLVSGRTYPVEVRYRPPVVEDEDEIDLPALVGDAVDELSSEGSGDILVFLPTEQEIREVAKTLGGRGRRGELLDILPLYGRLSEAEQNRIFQPSKNRRIVLATNVAESSLTVPGIHYVVDTGTARISRYAPQSKVQRLPIEAISRASADQRKGRCGRIAPGICIRLYSERTSASARPTPLPRFCGPTSLRSSSRPRPSSWAIWPTSRCSTATRFGDPLGRAHAVRTRSHRRERQADADRQDPQPVARRPRCLAHDPGGR